MAQLGTQKLGKDTSVGNDDGEGGGGTGNSAPKKSKQGPRKRVSQACDRCRSRKDKCDGKRPRCSTCTTNGRECSYDANVKKRGLPEGYVRGMEKLWGLAIREVEDIEDDILSALGGDEQSTGTPLNVWNDESNSETWVEVWRKSQMFQGLERLLSSLEPVTDSGKRKRADSNMWVSKKSGTRASLQQTSTFPDGAESGPATAGWPERNFDMRPSDNVQNLLNQPNLDDWQLRDIDMRQSSAQDSLNKQNRSGNQERYESILSPLNRPAVSSTPGTSIDTIPDLPSETWHLLDVYFSYTHSWLPIIEKHDLLRISYQYSQNRGNLSGSGSGDHAALWAAIAYAKFQHRAINNIPRALGSVGEMVWTAERMYSQARSLIPNEEGTLELGHVQALLILTLANLGMGYLSRAWLLIGQAVRAAIDLQLDQALEHILTSSKSKSRAKHVFLGCFVLDTIISARLGRRPHLRSEDIDTVGLLEEDGLEEWDPWTDCLNVRRSSSGNSRGPATILSTFNRLVQVLRILNEASCSAEGSNSLQLSTSLLEKLHIWSQSQSPPLYYDSNAMDSEQALSLLPHQHHLHTVYFNTFTASQLLSSRQGQENVNLEPCTRSARHITELLNRHSNIFGLLIVPPTYEYYVKTAYDVVNAVNSSIENTHIVLNDWKRSLDNCLETMEPAWPVFESFKNSVSYQSTSQPRRQSEVAFDLISGINQEVAASPMVGKTPQTVTSYETMSQTSPHPFESRISESSQHPQSRGKVTDPQFSQRTSSFGQSSGHGLPQNPLNIYEDAHATFGSAHKHPSQMHRLSQTSMDMTQQIHPRLQHAMSIGSDVDMSSDPTFHELMRLDATEWTGNWDQSLVNLGFTDRDNMNQDFYAFCQEPDPLHPNNVFQQLVANSNAEATDFFDGSAFGGMDMGIGSFTGFGFGDETEGIEAGQILQALSAGGNPGPAGPNR